MFTRNLFKTTGHRQGIPKKYWNVTLNILKYLIKWYRNYIKFNIFRMFFQSKTVARRNKRIYTMQQSRVNQVIARRFIAYSDCKPQG